MALVLDSAPLPWDNPRVQMLRDALTEAYPSGPKAEDLVSKVKGFPQHRVNWSHQDGASAIWKTVLKLAAQTAVLRRLLNQVLNDPTVAGHRARISAIIAELDEDTDPAVEAQPNTPIRRPTTPASQKTPDPHDIVLFSDYKRVVDPDRRVISFLAKATSSKRLVSNLEVNLDGKDAHQILDMLDLTSTPFIDDQVDKARKRFRKSVQRFANTWSRDHPMKTTDEEWLDVEEKISYRNKWFTLGEEIVQTQRELFRVACRNNLDRGEPVPQPGIGELTATYETQRDNQSPLIGTRAQR